MPEKSNIERLSKDVVFVLREMKFKGDEAELKYRINHMSNNEIFEAVLNHEGIINYSGTLKRVIEEIYEVQLNETRTTVTPVWNVDEAEIKEACNLLNVEFDNSFIQEVKQRVIGAESIVIEPIHEDIIHNCVYDMYVDCESKAKEKQVKKVHCEGCDNEYGFTQNEVDNGDSIKEE